MRQTDRHTDGNPGLTEVLACRLGAGESKAGWESGSPLDACFPGPGMDSFLAAWNELPEIPTSAPTLQVKRSGIWPSSGLSQGPKSRPRQVQGSSQEAISPSLTSPPIRGKDLEKQAGCSCRVEGVAGGAQGGGVSGAKESTWGEILLLLTRASCPIPHPPPLLAGPSPSLLQGISQAALAFPLH